MSVSNEGLLLDLLSTPTAPFREDQVVVVAQRWLERAGIAHFTDPAGNLVVGAASPRAYRALIAARSTEPVRLFVAHMDHPGFHGQRWRADGCLEVVWHGGSPVRHLRGARVWIAGPEGNVAEGRLVATTLHVSGRFMAAGEVRITAWRHDGRRPAARRLFGGFAFRAPVWRAGGRIYTKAADDLVGVFAVLSTAKRVLRQGAVPFLGLLTRGEEVGFVGAVRHFELGWLRNPHRPLVCVSLETSRTLPGARIGSGPVVRLGDRRTVFDPNALRVLAGVAERTLPGRHQRRIMDGGACEATAATAWGVPAVGISVPLGNYHNQGFEGGPDCRGVEGPAPEFVHQDDITGLLTLCRGLMTRGLAWASPWDRDRARLSRNAARYRTLLPAAAAGRR
ncbi:MAG: hypothetical protein B7Z66_06325 [Chromatiales bacterium 21-64-14]|nr:MAG: hypothetical protein B7Z66_06325 [Chromatiales bacterium 21-64-14]HQU15871.1 hypothetical protein [Gammaproteobacteria bacterium]